MVFVLRSYPLPPRLRAPQRPEEISLKCVRIPFLTGSPFDVLSLDILVEIA